jgi:hypothetical protein
MPPGFNFTINVIYLMKYWRNSNFASTIQARYPGENSADAINQATYFNNIHGVVTGSSNQTEL